MIVRWYTSGHMTRQNVEEIRGRDERRRRTMNSQTAVFYRVLEVVDQPHVRIIVRINFSGAAIDYANATRTRFRRDVSLIVESNAGISDHVAIQSRIYFEVRWKILSRICRCREFHYLQFYYNYFIAQFFNFILLFSRYIDDHKYNISTSADI